MLRQSQPKMAITSSLLQRKLLQLRHSFRQRRRRLQVRSALYEIFQPSLCKMTIRLIDGFRMDLLVLVMKLNQQDFAWFAGTKAQFQQLIVVPVSFGLRGRNSLHAWAAISFRATIATI